MGGSLAISRNDSLTDISGLSSLTSVGELSVAYDIWGDTVNIAARMESSGEPDQVNISQATYEAIRDRFVCTYRGEDPRQECRGGRHVLRRGPTESVTVAAMVRPNRPEAAR